VATYYELLGVEPDASVKDIRAAHRIRLQLVHPDKHQGASGAVLSEAERQTQLLNQALSILTDEQKRAEYDASLIVSARPEPPVKAAPRRRRDVDCPACGYRESALVEQRYVTCHACRTRYGFVTCQRCQHVQPALLSDVMVRCRNCDAHVRTSWSMRR